MKLAARRDRRSDAADAMAATRDELQAYFAKNSIQDKLNSLLNQLVIERPARPFVWLAEQLRNPSIRTSTFDPKPQLSPEDAEQLTRMWDYVVALTVPPGGAAAAKPPAAAAAAAGRPAAAAAASGEPLALSIMAGGAESVLLAIRPA